MAAPRSRPCPPAQRPYTSKQSGVKYLNLYVKHLGRAGFAVGGLLGEDDHKDAMTPPADCAHHVKLAGDFVEESGNGLSVSSVAVADLA